MDDIIGKVASWHLRGGSSFVLMVPSIELTAFGVILCSLFSLAAGLAIALIYRKQNQTNSAFVVTLALLPIAIQSIIMVVNGNLGTGIAVMGAFGLVRFRSVPGSAKELITIVFDMAVGLATGVGQIWYALGFVILVSFMLVLFRAIKFGEDKDTFKILKIVIPEDVDYTTAFEDIFREYTYKAKLERVRTIDLGSLYELRYGIELKDLGKEKELLDKVRQRNSNLDVSCSVRPPDQNTL
ncbi:MAG: DUF4956 domain-containing protein [Treponema sp.]|jgi:hypothetical protein|nr:DUF4956 domain-containing protein [Treponema sp.]